MHDPTLHMTMLFDFYGELLTQKQREYFDLYHNEDFSLAEIAEKAGITRQGVYDIINRAEKTLQTTEQKTKLIDRWHSTREAIEQIEEISEKITKQLKQLKVENNEITILTHQLQTTITKLK